MTLSRIEDCNEETLQIRLHMLGVDGIHGKGACVKKLKELQVLLIDKKLTAKYKKEKSLNFLNETQPFRGTPKHDKKDFTFQEPSYTTDDNNLEYRRYKPVSSANDSLVSNQLVLGSLDVYHDITYGPYKLNIGNKVYKLENAINQLVAHTEIQTPDSNVYTPIINFTHVSDYANVDTMTTSVKVLDQVVDLNIQIYFNEINLRGATFYITLPYQLDTSYYNTHEYVNGDINIHYDYVANTDNFKYDSSMSHVFIKTSEPTLLKIDSSLLICLSDHRNFFINKSRFKINLHISYHASNIDIHDSLHAMLSNIDNINANVSDLLATDPV